MSIERDAWLSAMIEQDAFRVAPADCGALGDHARDRNAFYFSKVDTRDVAGVADLLALGFFVADVNVVLGAPPAGLRSKPPSDVVVGPLTPAQTTDVLLIARTSFRFSRFHLDPHVKRPVADRIKEEWVRSYIDGRRGDRLFVAAVDGKVAGFLAALTTGTPSSAVIDLIAVHERAQRRGVAQALITAFAEHYRTSANLIVGTQVANIPSVRLYESMGFRLESSQYVLHRHVRDGATQE